MSAKLQAFAKNYGAFSVIFGMVIAGHMGWKYLQDTGIGDQGRDYSVKNLPEVFGKYYKEKVSGPKMDKDPDSGT